MSKNKNQVVQAEQARDALSESGSSSSSPTPVADTLAQAGSSSSLSAFASGMPEADSVSVSRSSSVALAPTDHYSSVTIIVGDTKISVAANGPVTINAASRPAEEAAAQTGSAVAFQQKTQDSNNKNHQTGDSIKHISVAETSKTALYALNNYKMLYRVADDFSNKIGYNITISNPEDYADAIKISYLGLSVINAVAVGNLYPVAVAIINEQNVGVKSFYTDQMSSFISEEYAKCLVDFATATIINGVFFSHQDALIRGGIAGLSCFSGNLLPQYSGEMGILFAASKFLTKTNKVMKAIDVLNIYDSLTHQTKYLDKFISFSGEYINSENFHKISNFTATKLDYAIDVSKNFVHDYLYEGAKTGSAKLVEVGSLAQSSLYEGAKTGSAKLVEVGSLAQISLYEGAKTGSAKLVEIGSLVKNYINQGTEVANAKIAEFTDLVSKYYDNYEVVVSSREVLGDDSFIVTNDKTD